MSDDDDLKPAKPPRKPAKAAHVAASNKVVHISGAAANKYAATTPEEKAAKTEMLQSTLAEMRRLAAELLDEGADAPRPAFDIVDMNALETLEEEPQRYFIEAYVPRGHATLLGGHGGAGKSFLALQAALCVGLGKPFFGNRVEQAKVFYFSAEDPAPMVLQRLLRLCKQMGFDRGDVAKAVQLLDATEEPVLFTEVHSPGLRTWQTTRAYAALQDLLESEPAGVFLIVDNASDTFDGNEVKRTQVRAFIRELVKLVRDRGGAVLLLAHVDKLTSRGAGKGETNSESYSGSTAWHNSVRSRLYMVTTAPGRFELNHQKQQFGEMAEPLSLIWPKHGCLQLAGAGWPLTGIESKQPQVDERDTRVLLKLIVEYAGRGEIVSTATSGVSNMHKTLGADKTYPKKRAAGEVFELMRDAERAGFVKRTQHRGKDRKPAADRWEVTAAGRDFAGVPPP